MKNLLINFYAKDITTEDKNDFLTAVEYSQISMTIMLVSDSMAKLELKIANKTGSYTDEDITAFKAQLETLTATRLNLETTKTKLESVYNKVLDAMTVKNEDRFGNRSEVVKTVLNVLATWNNSKLVKYAIIPAFQSPELYEALETIHITSTADDDGMLILTDDVKQAYKKASQELETIIKTTFSLSFETPYTAQMRVKLNATDKKLLNDCYVKGFTNKFDTDDDGNVSFKKRQINTLVKVKTDKKTGIKTYNYSGLAETICNIVIRHYFA